MLSAILRRQLAAETFLPKYSYHVRDSIVALEDGRVLFCVRLNGIPFEAVSDGVLENHYDALNTLFVSIGKTAGARASAWLHLDHYQTEFRTDYRFEHRWMQDFSDRYMQKFAQTDSFENAFYITLLLKPGLNDEADDCIRELEELQIIVMQSLALYEPELLAMYEYQGHTFSQVYEFLAYLCNGFRERVPVTSLPLREAIPSSVLHHGYTLIETRFPDGGHRYAAFFDLKDFPETTTRGKLNPVLELPFPFLLCFSFTFIYNADMLKQINAALNKMQSARDEAVDQMNEMSEGKGAIAAGLTCFGEFHGALAVYGDTEKQTEDRGAAARTTLSSSCATLFVPAAVSAPATFFSMFPGNAKHRPRPMPKTTRNLTGMFSMNNYSSGKHYGNPVGDGASIIPLKTSVRGVYHFNFHYSLPEIDSLGEKRAGHTLIFGATGSGKTTLQTTLLSFIRRKGFDAKIFSIDKDGSMRGFIEANGGTYFTLPAGEPTGLNPFQLPDTTYNRDYLYDLVTACGQKPGQNIPAEDIKDIKRAVDNVFELPFEHRRFGVLLQSIPDRGEDCLARRLAEWCYSDENLDGRYAYALDNPANAFDWEDFRVVGFDVTDFLVAGHPATEPILSYLFHLKTLMQRDGGLLATVVEEFWLPISYPTTANQILDSLKVGRRRDEFIVLITQSPEDAIKSPLLPSILQQTPTKIYLPNPDAEYETSDGGGYARFGLTPKEFDKLKKLGLQSRQFLVKQGSQSSIARLDLDGMGDDIAVLAMAAEDFPLLEATRDETGGDPDRWVPRYKELRRCARKKPPQTPPGAAGQQQDRTAHAPLSADHSPEERPESVFDERENHVTEM